MSILPPHPLVADALDLAHTWCAGHLIDHAPADAHAIRVASVLNRHLDPAPDELLAAALLHDAPDFAPADIDLDALLTTRFSPAVTATVRALQTEHTALNYRAEPDTTTLDDWTLHASVADKIVSLTSILRRAENAENPAAYWQQRPAFVARVAYFTAFSNQAQPPRIPPRMATELAHLTTRAATETRDHQNSAGAQPGG
jgi:hypothetical protein